MAVAVLRLELFGEHVNAMCAVYRAAFDREGYAEARDHLRDPMRRPWVAELTGRDARFGYARRFLRPALTDYSASNAIGSRGVVRHYHLREGAVYEVHERVSWGRSRRYACRVEGGAVVEMTDAEVRAWLDR